MRPAIIFAALLSLLPLGATDSFAQQTQRSSYEFVSQFLDGLVALNRAEDGGNPAKGFEQVAACVRTNTAIQLRLSSLARDLRATSVAYPYETVPVTLALLYEAKAKVHDQLQKACTDALKDANGGAERGATIAKVANITAQMKYVNEENTKASALPAMMLKTTSDTSGPTRLTITASQRSKLLSEIKTNFGKKLTDKQMSYPVAAASVLNGVLSDQKLRSSD